MARMWVAGIVLGGIMSVTAFAQTPTKASEKYRWNLNDLYTTPAAFDAARLVPSMKCPSTFRSR